MARPKKNPNDLHDEPIRFYVKPSEKELLLKACKDFDKDQSPLIREMFFAALKARYSNVTDKRTG